MADDGAVALALVSRLIVRLASTELLPLEAIGDLLRDTMLDLQKQGHFHAREMLRALVQEIESSVPGGSQES